MVGRIQKTDGGKMTAQYTLLYGPLDGAVIDDPRLTRCLIIHLQAKGTADAPFFHTYERLDGQKVYKYAPFNADKISEI